MGQNFENDNVKEIALRIMELRDACGFTQEEFAQKLGIEVQTYKEYEENASGIPISLICNIANICGVELSEIMTGVSANLHTLQIVKKGKAQSAQRYPGYHLEDMAYRFADKVMQPFLATLDPKEPVADLAVHGGQEFNYVLEGTMELRWGDRVYVLEEGDSVYFDPTRPHGQKCHDGKPVKFITVIAE